MKKKTLIGTIKTMPDTNIYLNINYLKNGNYKLKIVHKNRIIKTTQFIKK